MLQIEKLTQNLNIATTLQEALDISEKESTNGVFEDLKSITLDLTNQFEEDSLLIVTLNFINNLLAFFASGKYKLSSLRKLCVMIDKNVYVKQQREKIQGP